MTSDFWVLHFTESIYILWKKKRRKIIKINLNIKKKNHIYQNRALQCFVCARKVCIYIFSVSAADWWFSTFVFMTFRQGHKVCGFISRDSAAAVRCEGIIYNTYIIGFFTRKISFWSSRHLLGGVYIRNILFDLLSQDPLPSSYTPTMCVSFPSRVYCPFWCLFFQCRGPPQVPGGLIVFLRLHFILFPFGPPHNTV